MLLKEKMDVGVARDERSLLRLLCSPGLLTMHAIPAETVQDSWDMEGAAAFGMSAKERQTTRTRAKESKRLFTPV